MFGIQIVTVFLFQEEVHWKKLIQLAGIGNIIHNLMSGNAYQQGTHLEDPRVSDIPSNAKLLEKFRERYYSILFCEKPRQNGVDVQVSEFCMSGKGSLDEPVTKKIEEAPKYHPGLETLWNKDDRSVDPIRYNILVLSNFAGWSRWPHVTS